MKIVVDATKVLNAASRDVASGSPDSEKLVVAYVRARLKGLRWYERALFRLFSPAQYRSGVRRLHKLLGKDSITLEV